MSGWDDESEDGKQFYNDTKPQKEQSGWGDESEDGNRFELSPNDFTLVKIQDEDARMPETYQSSLFIKTQREASCENFFYGRLGFKTGNYFEGEKRIYSKRAK